jgi:hypothetical protein
MIPLAGWRQNPRLIHKLRKIDAATLRPPRMRAGRNDQFVIEEHFHIQVLGRALVGERKRNSLHYAVILSLPQPRADHLRCADTDVVNNGSYR